MNSSCLCRPIAGLRKSLAGIHVHFHPGVQRDMTVLSATLQIQLLLQEDVLDRVVSKGVVDAR